MAEPQPIRRSFSEAVEDVSFLLGWQKTWKKFERKFDPVSCCSDTVSAQMAAEKEQNISDIRQRLYRTLGLENAYVPRSRMIDLSSLLRNL